MGSFLEILEKIDRKVEIHLIEKFSFTAQAEKIMEDLLKMALEKDDVSAEAFEYELTHPDKSMVEEALEAVTKNRKSHLNIGKSNF